MNNNGTKYVLKFARNGEPYREVFFIDADNLDNYLRGIATRELDDDNKIKFISLQRVSPKGKVQGKSSAMIIAEGNFVAYLQRLGINGGHTPPRKGVKK